MLEVGVTGLGTHAARGAVFAHMTRACRLSPVHHEQTHSPKLFSAFGSSRNFSFSRESVSPWLTSHGPAGPLEAWEGVRLARHPLGTGLVGFVVRNPERHVLVAGSLTGTPPGARTISPCVTLSTCRPGLHLQVLWGGSVDAHALGCHPRVPSKGNACSLCWDECSYLPPDRGKRKLDSLRH